MTAVDDTATGAGRPDTGADPDRAADGPAADRARVDTAEAPADLAADPDTATDAGADVAVDAPAGMAAAVPATAAKPAATDTPATATDSPDATADQARRRPGLVLPAVLAIAALVIGALGVWLTVEAADARDEPAARNTALVDTGTTAEVSTAVTNALNQVFSYSYDKPEATERAAAEVLRGPALSTYDQLFAQVRELAPQQQIVLTTRVVHLAVQSIVGNRAQLLVFLDQSATRADNATTSSGAAQLSVTAERQGDDWLIIDLTPR